MEHLNYATIIIIVTVSATVTITTDVYLQQNKNQRSVELQTASFSVNLSQSMIDALAHFCFPPSLNN